MRNLVLMGAQAKFSRACASLVALAVVFSACLVSPPAAFPSSETTQASSPPGGLTQYGLEVWELDALLHDRFGKQSVNLEGAKSSSNFTTSFVPVAGGGFYTYTFEDASHSTFKLMRPRRPPKMFPHGIDSPTDPFTVDGAYISCGHQRWLYRDPPAGSVNEWIACLAPPSGAPVRFDARCSSAPVSGLTQFGRYLWALDALLHDNFGRRPVYQQDGPDESSSFTTRPKPAARGYTWTYTFADASHSSFKLMRPTHRPQPNIGGTAASYPLTIDGAYISCGHGLWLYGIGGDPHINDSVWCELPPPPAPPQPATGGSNNLLRTRGTEVLLRP